MRNIIEYYYRFVNINVFCKDGKYIFYYGGFTYVFFICERDIEELSVINNLIKDKSIYSKIMYNINNSPLTFVDGKNYILIKSTYNLNTNITYVDLLRKRQIYDYNKYSLINYSDWYNLWCKKIDYIIYQREHVKNKYVILDSYLEYFIGMGECAIAYLRDINDRKDTIYVLSHKRINDCSKLSYYNSVQLIIDHPARDVSEYLKYLFFHNKIDKYQLYDFISKLSFSCYGYKLLFARMLFPTYFFDIYEDIVVGGKREILINSIVTKITQYEEFLKMIGYLINKKTKIPIIEWLS